MRGSLLVLALFAAACSRDSGSAAPAPSASVVQVRPPRVPPPLPHKPPPPPCRALAVAGPDAGIPPGTPLTGPTTLLAGERLSVKEPASGREFDLVGPGVATACDAEMHTRLVRGRFESSRGSGEAPGADKWVVTPLGVVSYEASVIEVVVTPSSLRVTVKNGSAAVLLGDAAPDTAWTIVTAATPFVAHAADGPMDASARCAEARASEKTLDDSLSDAGGAFGELAEKAAAARRRARVVCALASLTDSAP